MTAPRILIVEDERIVALNLQQLLVKLDYNVTGLAVSGEQALEQIEAKRPDLVLMDIHIGGAFDGIDVATRIPANLLIPVIYLTAYSDQQTLDRARATKPYGYLLKPFAERELHASIQMALARRDTEAEKWEVEERLRLTLDAAEMGPWELDADAQMIHCSGQAGPIFGVLPDEAAFSLEQLLEQVNAEDRQAARMHFTRLPASSTPYRFEFRLQAPEHRQRWLALQGRWFTGLIGDKKRVFGVVRDISAQRESEEALQASEELHRTMVAALGEGILLCESDGRVSMCNAAAGSIFGVPPEAILGTHFFQSVEALREDGKLVPIAEHPELDVLATGAKVRGRIKGIRRRDGEIRWVSVNVEPLSRAPDQKPYAMLASFSDLTDLKLTEERLLQSQKLEAVGQLTGGIAHDFNNLLTVILGNSEVLVDQLSENRRLRELAEMTRAAAIRGADLTSRLLAFSRRQALAPHVTDVAGLVRGIEKLIMRTLGEHIDIRITEASGVSKAMIDPSQLEAALLNLCINARDAMPAGGKLLIEIANARLDQVYALHHEDVAPGDYVMVSVADTGTGMSAEVVQRAFEPFFTTKGVGRGSGLGLSMVYGFVKQSGGHVKIYTEIGHGTVVKLYLPTADRDAKSDAADDAVAEEPRGAESILLVEDDDLVRTVVELQLVGLGYKVMAARDGPEALKALSSGPSVDLLFTDMVIPGGMNGRELAEAACRLMPSLRVLFTSGYTEDAIIRHGLLDRGIILLNKPFRRNELAAKIRQALGGASAFMNGATKLH